jgi:hypothetical protein
MRAATDTYMRMLAANECNVTRTEDLSNSTFIAVCMDCELINITNTSEKILSFSDCAAQCKSTYSCFSIEYNRTSRACLLNFDRSRNVHVAQLPRNSSSEVWKLVSQETAALYTPLTANDRILSDQVST